MSEIKHSLRKSMLLVSLICAFGGCVTSSLPRSFAQRPPPGSLAIEFDRRAACPNLTGQYDIIPVIAQSVGNGEWTVEKGSENDHFAALPYFYAEEQTGNTNSFAGTLSIESRNSGTEIFVSHSLSGSKTLDSFFEKKNHFRCKEGVVEFPEFIVQGLADGSKALGRTRWSCGISIDKRLVCYKQVSSVQLHHIYSVFDFRSQVQVPD